MVHRWVLVSSLHFELTGDDLENYVDIQIEQFRKEYDMKLNNHFRMLCDHFEETNRNLVAIIGVSLILRS